MRAKLVYSAPVGVSDSLEEPITDAKILKALAGISIPEASVLEYLYTDFPNQDEFRGGFLRLALDGKKLRVRIEIDTPRKLTKAELAELRDAFDGQVSDGIGESGFDYLADETGVSVMTFPDDGGKSTLVQTTGDAWKPGKLSAEEAANDKRCKSVAKAVKAAEKAEAAKDKKKGGKPSTKALFKHIANEHRKGVTTEIAKLGGDLSFIKSGQFPYELLHNRPILRLLLDAGLNPNMHDRDGHSLLWLTVGNADCVTLMLDRGADMNFRNADPYEETALMHAAGFGNIKCVRVLLERGADPKLKSRSGNTALDAARQGTDYGGGLAEVIRVLKKAAKKK